MTYSERIAVIGAITKSLLAYPIRDDNGKPLELVPMEPATKGFSVENILRKELTTEDFRV